MPASSNFTFLAEHDPVFLQLATTAEQVFAADPNTTLIKLRQLGEALAQDVAARAGVQFDAETSQADLLFRLNREIKLDPTVRELFHTLRIEGNKATHQFRTQHKEAMDGLKVARALAIWFHQSFGKAGAAFKAGPFVPPQDPSLQLRELHAEIDALKAELLGNREALDTNQQLAALLAREKEEFAVLAQQMDAEARTYQSLTEEQSAAVDRVRAEFEARIAELQTQLADSQKAAQSVTQATQSASKQLVLSEELTRILIDQQLAAAGWEADTQNLKYAKGTRPEKGKQRAIAEWPTTGKQAADYVLFAGLSPVAVVEAKRENENVAGKIPQAERYSRGFKQEQGFKPAWELAGLPAPWPDGQGDAFQIPFVYSSNSRPYLQQLAEQSGIWFRDVRSPANLARPLMDFHTPEGLLDQLHRSKEAAEAKLKAEGFAYLQLRPYQEKAIQAVEAAIAAHQSACLLAMATGTGKTRTIIGLIYRFLKAERFRRILFLVDRTALGTQALDAFGDALLEQNQPLSKIYNIAELGDMAAEAETRVQVATVQAMVKRIFQSDDPPGIDAFDCVIVDEAHRGYTLDQEMSEGELQVRDQGQYLSTYRRVLDYFDAVKVGLTATPARHTTEIFGRPVYTYSYREAVADDWLIDHEPPIRYQTLLSQKGIKFDKGETVSAINLGTGEIEQAELEDELNFEVEAFNRRVIVDDFNRVICEQLAQELDPFSEEKTMVFCATDLHADMVKRLLDDAFKAVHGDAYNEAAVRKITGKSDKVSELIKRYKNERYPNIAITVDLLTTGIDVPRIAHLVFMRRVRSRILYEQMIGRATRRCDEIGKTVFKIYDPVDLYSDLQEVSTMKPLVKDPNVTLEQLLGELHNPESFNAPGSRSEQTHAHDVLDALSQKLMRVLRDATHKAEKKPALKTRLAELEALWGVAPAELHKHLKALGPQDAAAFLRQQAALLQQIDEVKALVGSAYMPVLSDHKDQLVAREQSYGAYNRPEDYLDSFNHFVREQLNQSAALAVVVNRPKDLTREQLKEVRLLLDQHGFTEARLQSAWRNATNHDIAASIIGYIRQAALGEALLPFEQRVAQAMQRIYMLTNWSTVQRKWLERLAKQLTHEVVIDTQFVNVAFQQDGGAKRLDHLLGGKLGDVLDQLATGIWSEAA
ncbi:type I restriction-modification system endonuclease [Niveibacterium sp. 24ML]|uniref:type I restriction-modification system endonuclease n=1 Tax=Niveibacterium sp. 24ML TaxID=2985512 RepID=UPI0022700DFF|nr:type I restriction-modification system endonuclease [Niveibacterium sp. 24ML]MCX9157270.1 type I restriction-modification system endonuclease [Niveibacterium sp. 24ML]